MKNLAILSFLFTLVASLSLGIPNADAGSKESQSEFGKEADNSDLENQESKDTSSDETIDNADTEEGEGSSEVESEDISDNEFNESTTTLSENMSNFTTSTSNPESITMTPSDLGTGNQTSNQTKVV